MAGSIPLRLQDTKQAAWADGKRDIFLVIYKQPGAELRELVGHDPVRPRVSSQKPNLIAANGPIRPLLMAEAAVPASVLCRARDSRASSKSTWSSCSQPRRAAGR